MGKLILFMHTSLDGFVAGPNGEMDWIHIDDEMFAHVHSRVDKTDIAMYGRVTYQMMENYWPTAGDSPNASEHDKHHSKWYMNANKVVLSRTIKDTGKANAKVISENLVDEINKVKQKSEKEILIFGSPSVGHALMEKNLLDGYWLFQNPILIGKGIPLFKNVNGKSKLKLLSNHVFKSGVMALSYTAEN